MAGLGLVLAGSKLRRLYDTSQQNLADMRQMHELSLNLAMLPTVQHQLDLILRSLAEMYGTGQGLISCYEPESNRLKVAASLGFSSAALDSLKEVKSGEGACGLACLDRRRVVVTDTEQDPRFARFRELARQEGFRSVHSTPFFSNDGQVMGAVSLHFVQPHFPTTRELRLAEIFARKIAIHLERARAEALARASDQRLRHVVDTSTISFTVLSPVMDMSGTIVDFRWEYVNPCAAKTLKHDATQLAGRRVSEVLPGSWSEPNLFESYVAVVLRNEVREFEVHSTQSGVDAWFEVIASPLDGNVAVWFADISERKRQELELRTADRRKDEFLATLAHELRNPLAPIRQAAALSGKPNVTPAQRQWCNEVIERQTQHMALLLDDLLDVSRITKGTLQLRKQVTTLKSLIESAIETSRPNLENKKHALHVELIGDDSRLYVDPLRMSQVISNLLNNAAKYTNAGGTIRLSGRISGADLVLSVADNGIGIPQGELQSIFSMFSQLRSSQEFSEGGLGIGLALTKGLVELHGGRIVAESPGPGAGSTFTITLVDAVRSEAEEPRTKDSAAVARLVRNVLLADDNVDAAESLAMLLRSDGHRVSVAHDGEAALALFAEIKPDVVLLDLGMPKLSGFEVAKRIREHENAAGVLLVAITGWGQSSDRVKSAAAGFDHHVTKPVDYLMLGELISPNPGRERLTDEIGRVHRATKRTLSSLN